MSSLVPAATLILFADDDTADLDETVEKLTAAWSAAQDRLVEAEAYVDYTETLYKVALESNLPLPQVAEREVALDLAVDALGEVTKERDLYARSLRTLLEAMPERD